MHLVCLSYLRRDSGPFSLIIEIVPESPVLGMDETTSKPEDAALSHSHSDSGPLERVRDPGGLESEGLTLRSGRSGSILRGRTPHPSQMSDSQALTEFDMVQGKAGLSPSEGETVTSFTVSAAAADLSIYLFI